MIAHERSLSSMRWERRCSALGDAASAYPGQQRSVSLAPQTNPGTMTSSLYILHGSLTTGSNALDSKSQFIHAVALNLGAASFPRCRLISSREKRYECHKTERARRLRRKASTRLSIGVGNWRNDVTRTALRECKAAGFLAPLFARLPRSMYRLIILTERRLCAQASWQITNKRDTHSFLCPQPPSLFFAFCSFRL